MKMTTPSAIGKEAPELDEDTPMGTRLAAMKWEDAGVANEDTRKPRHDPDNFEPAVRLENRGVTTYIGKLGKLATLTQARRTALGTPPCPPLAVVRPLRSPGRVETAGSP
jgi:hypothetical protein